MFCFRMVCTSNYINSTKAIHKEHIGSYDNTVTTQYSLVLFHGPLPTQKLFLVICKRWHSLTWKLKSLFWFPIVVSYNFCGSFWNVINALVCWVKCSVCWVKEPNDRFTELSWKVNSRSLSFCQSLLGLAVFQTTKWTDYANLYVSFLLIVRQRNNYYLMWKNHINFLVWIPTHFL